MSVKEALSSQIAIIGENMNIRRFEQVQARQMVLLHPTSMQVERLAFW